MMSLEQMKEFVERAESGQAKASDFVDNSYDIIRAFKDLIRRVEVDQKVADKIIEVENYVRGLE